MADRKAITPKQIVGHDGRHRYTITFDPNSPVGSQWVWQTDYVRTYTHYGSSSTQAMAVKAARKLIHAMNKHMIEEDERDA